MLVLLPLVACKLLVPAGPEWWAARWRRERMNQEGLKYRVRDLLVSHVQGIPQSLPAVLKLGVRLSEQHSGSLKLSICAQMHQKV